MRICHVTSVHSRYDIRICEKECVSLRKKGYDTYLVVNDQEDDEEYKGIHILSTKRKKTRRIERILFAPKKVLKIAMKVDADIYHLHDPELLFIADKLLKNGKKVIFDAHEDVEKQIMYKQWIPYVIRPLVGKIYATYSSNKLRKMDAIISVTPSLINKLKKFNNKVAMVTNYPIIECDEVMRLNDKKDRFSTTSIKTNDEYVFFAGGVSEQWCHESIIEAVNEVGKVTYILAGRGNKDYIAILRKKENTKYLGTISHEKVMRIYKGAVAGMAILKTDTQSGKEGTLGNTKLFEIMETGKPVICSNLRLWENIIKKNNCGICVDPDNISSISKAIQFLMNNPDMAEEMGKNGRRAVEKEYNWGTQEKELYSVYEDVWKENK